MTDPSGLPRIEDFRTDLGPAEIAAGEAANVRAVAMQAYLLRPDGDGGLTIHVAADRPDGVPEGNWLPAPRGQFNVALRTYFPLAPIREGSWFPPGIVRVS